MAMTKPRKGRFHMRIDNALLEAIRKYAEQRHLTVTALVEQQFVKLLEEERAVKDAEQI